MGEERWVVPGIRFRILGLSLHISIAVKETGFTVSVRAIHWIQVVQLPLRLYRLYINRGVVRVVVVLVKNGKKKTNLICCQHYSTVTRTAHHSFYGPASKSSSSGGINHLQKFNHEIDG